MKNKDLANALVYAYLNCNTEDNEGAQPAAAELLEVLSDYLDDTDLGLLIDEALRAWRSPLSSITIDRSEAVPAIVRDILHELKPGDWRLPILQTWLREDHGIAA